MEFSKANGVKYFAGGDTLLSRFISLHHKYNKEEKKSNTIVKMLKELKSLFSISAWEFDSQAGIVSFIMGG